MKKLVIRILLTFVLSFFGVSSSFAGLLSGPITAPYSWGDGNNNIRTGLSDNVPEYTRWFYGSAYNSFTNADVYVYYGLSDPMTISDASLFNYHDSSTTIPVAGHPDWPDQIALLASESDIIFFKSVDGYYGAWKIDDFFQGGVSGTWYFLDDGSADFTNTGNVPIPGAVWLLGSGLLGLAGVSKSKKGR
ncbi:MAG: hypothetical protein GY699_08415 [Desulfobacteraceae bacterium]|nr:hypothetical protein [Desulfobacteraceae bacterium]